MSSNLIAPAPPAYYSPETQPFPQLQQTFADTGQMHPEAFYLILDWKASRARKKHLHLRRAARFDPKRCLAPLTGFGRCCPGSAEDAGVCAVRTFLAAVKLNIDTGDANDCNRPVDRADATD
jgi:hypothetical protein